MLSTAAARRQLIAYIGLLVVSLLLLAFSNSAPLLELRRGVGFAMAPIQAVVRDSTRQVTSVFAALGEIERLRQLNAELQRRVDELEIENRQLESLRHENEELAGLLDVRASLSHETVAARVISRRLTAQERVISIDRGSSSGIGEDDPVVAGGGALVGQVLEVGPNFSRVLLLSDTRFVVAGMAEGSRATGDVHGQLDRPLAMAGIPATDTLNVGEAVLTAGIDLGGGIRSPFPGGLLIGTVADVQSSPNQVVQSALVAPAAALDRLEYVLVIVNYTSGDQPALPTPGAAPTVGPAP
ncbi:MAG: rod shape-determining protein MreC [Chloroflexota bacterium]|nr:rod shape-determining protein MreC [Chloroflexota bacterium]